MRQCRAPSEYAIYETCSNGIMALLVSPIPPCLFSICLLEDTTMLQFQLLPMAVWILRAVAMANSRVEVECQRKSHDLFHSSLLEVRLILIDLRTHALTQSAEQNVSTRFIPYATEIIATVCIIFCATLFCRCCDFSH
jgi:hypothetical protein